MRYSSSITLVLFTMILASTAGAQQRDTTATRQQQADSTPTPLYTVAPLVVTVSKVPLPWNQVGFALSVVTAEALTLERPQYVANSLRSLPGSYIDEAAGPGGPTIVRLRGGEEVFTQILFDGVKVNQNGGFFDFQGLALSNLEQVEVLRGPQSALYGSSAVSGVVHFISRRGEPGPPRLRFAAEGGNAVVNGGSFRVFGEVDGGVDWLRYSGGLGTAYNRGIYQVPNDTRTGEGSLRLDATFSDRWGLTGTFRYVGVEGNLPVRDPGATRVPLDPNARNERDRIVTALRAAFSQSRSWSYILAASLYDENFLFEDRRDSVAEQSGPFDFFIFDADFTLDSDLHRGTVEYAGVYQFQSNSERSLTFTYGGLWQREELTDRTGGEFGEGTLKLDRNNIAGYAELQTDLVPRVNLLLGSRVEKYEELSTEITPRLSARVALVPSLLTLRAAAGRGYRAPNLQQQFLDNPFIAANPELKAETSTSWEIGVDLRDDERAASIGLAYFRQHFDNLIRTVAQEDTSQQINRNLGSSRAQGVEWTLQYRPSFRWLLGTEGAWVHTEILDNTGLPEDQFPVGEELPFRPKITGSAFVEVNLLSRFTAIVRAAFVGEQTVLTERFSGEREELDPYVLFNLRANYEVSPRFLLYTRLDNLFDVEYETAFDRTGIPFTFAFGAQVTAGTRTE
jgi:vitamin B12 transporter